MKNSGSNLTSTIGLIILFVLIFVAAYIRIPALEAFLIIIFILCLISWLWTIFALKKVSLTLKEREIYSFPGNELTINAETFNRKFFPIIWLKVCLSGRNMQIIDSDSAARTITWIMPWQQLSWNWKITALSRGVCTLDSFDLQSGDGFGLSDKTRSVKNSAPLRIVVFPKLIPVDISFIRRHVKELENSPFGFYSDRTLLKCTRPYNGYENSRNINWRSLAKGNEPEVNIYEQQSMRRVCFIPDLESFTYEEIKEENGNSHIITHVRREELEHTISMIASIISSSSDQSIVPSLVIPGYKDHDTSLTSADGSSSYSELLTVLAEIDYESGKTALSPAMIEDKLHILGQIFIFSYSRSAVRCKLPDSINALYILSSVTEETENDNTYFSASLIDCMPGTDKTT